MRRSSDDTLGKIFLGDTRARGEHPACTASAIGVDSDTVGAIEVEGFAMSRKT